jgi:hypothetical protein
MTPAYKVLICQRATGQVMNTDASTVFSPPPTTEAALPYCYFDTLAEAERFAWKLHQENHSLELVLYAGDDYLQMIPAGKASNS